MITAWLSHGWPLSLPEHDHCPGLDLIAMDHVANREIDQVAATQPAVDGKIEQGEFSNTLVKLMWHLE